MAHIYVKLLIYTLCVVGSQGMMIRNDALISKMVSNFQKDNSITVGTTPRSEGQHKNVLSIMQGVLCKNFPTIPCDMIIEDETLKSLIERSIQQLKYKKLSMDRTTMMPSFHLTLFPTVNGEDLSNFPQVSQTGFYTKVGKDKVRTRRHRKRRIIKSTAQDREYKKRTKKGDSQRTTMYSGNKAIRKFYPHKIKYKDKQKKANRENYNKDYSEEKLSMSIENPEGSRIQKKMSSNYNMNTDAVDPPVWRIDYMKHGEPGLNMFGYEADTLKEKLVKTGPNVIIGDNMMEQLPRKDVLHTDVYIKKNYIRKNGLDLTSDAMDK